MTFIPCTAFEGLRGNFSARYQKQSGIKILGHVEEEPIKTVSWKVDWIGFQKDFWVEKNNKVK